MLCPGTSDVNFLGDLERVVDLYTEVANSAFDLGMAEQKLHRTQVPSATVDQRHYGSFGASNAWRICTDRGQCRQPTLIPAGHSGASSRACPDLGVLETGIRRACARHREGSRRGPAAWAQSAQSELAYQSSSAEHWLGRWHSRWALHHRPAAQRGRYHAILLSTARLNIAKSRVRFSRWSFARMAQT